MYRVLLPEGELTVSTSIEFLFEEVIDGGTRLVSEDFAKGVERRALFIHCKMPYTHHDGVFIGNLTLEKVQEIKTQLLEKGFYDFSNERMGYHYGVVSAFDSEPDEVYYVFLEEQDFQKLLK